MLRPVKTDCRFYRGARPCDPHKAAGVTCGSCAFYEPVADRIAIVKLDAMGDVLRTTALLPDIRRRHPNAHVTWITRPESVALFQGNSLVDCVVPTDRAIDILTLPRFACVYALENSELGVHIAASLDSAEYRGFRVGPSGKVEGVHEGGDPTLYEIGLWDDLKRQNTRSYLEMLAATAGVSYERNPPIITISASEAERARETLEGFSRPVVAFNTDAGERWLRKRWNLEYVEQTALRLAGDGYGIALLGGERSAEFNESLASRHRAIRAFHTADDIRAFLAIISQVDVLVTGDTLAMHAAYALRTPVVALFGPTSLPEIDLAPNDIKLAAVDLECLGCYLHTCNVSPHCMDRLTPDAVTASILRRLSLCESSA